MLLAAQAAVVSAVERNASPAASRAEREHIGIALAGRVHDLVVWDTRCTLHRATTFDKDLPDVLARVPHGAWQVGNQQLRPRIGNQ